MGEAFFFPGVGDGDSSSTDGVRFFLGEGVADGAGDSFSRSADDFFGVGVGVGDFFFAATALFFLRGFGVGVGVEKILFIVLASDCSAARVGATVETARTRVNRARTSIVNGLTD